MKAFILARDEAENIGRSVGAARAAGFSVTVLDSGSRDETRARAEAAGARVEPYRYVDHLTAYNDVCRERLEAGELGLVLDADMVLSPSLATSLQGFATRPDVQVVLARVEMWWDGAPLPFGSLYPPKPIAFRGGGSYFQAAGHGEQLRPEVKAALAHGTLAHDDRKPYETYLSTQARYAANLVRRAREGSLSFRDRLRLFTPAMMVGVPLYSLLVRGGVASGKRGWVYALDRLIAEAVMLRQGLAARARAAAQPSSDETSRS